LSAAPLLSQVLPQATAGAVQTSPGELQALKLLLDEIRTRLRYLCDVGIGYLTLDRQSRTLSGGEVQRINLTTALGTSLVNTLFVLDEPSIGLHPRDMNRITEAMQRLRDAGNTLVVVEHDPAVMLAADRMIDMGPGPGERGGRSCSTARPKTLRSADTLTGAYLGGASRWHGLQAGGNRCHAAADPGRRARAQPAERDGGLPAAAPGVRHRRQRLGQVHADPGRAGPALMRHFGKATETPGAHDRLLGADHLATWCSWTSRPSARPRAPTRSATWAPGTHAQALCRRAAGARARLHAGTFSFNSRRRALPHLRRLGLRACGDAVPQRRVPALPRLRRQALPPEILDVTRWWAGAARS
jgi:excinuclease ABC subunit A